MSKARKTAIVRKPDELFERVVRILEQARGNVVRSVNSNMVLAYWLIGREIVEAVQKGEARAEYGQQVLEQLCARLTRQYGSGFSLTNLGYFRQFYLVYADRCQIPRLEGGDLTSGQIRSQVGTALGLPIPHPAGGELAKGFSPQLSWSHYRAMMRVDDREARLFYEREAAECGWSKSQLERQIHSFYYQRIIELKIGRLTHRDVGQMDGYVRMYDEQFRVPGDNPTVGLILCSDKGEAVARYSVLRENRQVFASRYMQFLPTEDQLRREIEKERNLIEAAWAEEREGKQQ